MLKVERLEVRNIRGIGSTGPDLELGGKSLILLGENGSGKSSYVDALEYVLTRQSTSLDIGKQGVSWRLGGAHIRARGQPSIRLIVSDSDKSVHTISLADDPAELPEPLRSWVSRSKAGGFVLRRRSMLTFIDSDPSERYKSISTFLDMAQYVRFENLLKSVLTTWDTALSSAKQNEQVLVSRLQTRLGIASDVTEQSVLAALNKKLLDAGRSAALTRDGLKAVRENLEMELAKFHGIEQATALQVLRSSIDKVPTQEALVKAYDGAISAVRARDDLSREITGGFFEDVLRSGLKWVEDYNLNYCPLCEREFDSRQVFVERVRKRLEDNFEYISAVSRADAAILTLRNALGDLAESLRHLLSLWVAQYPGSELQGEIEAFLRALPDYESQTDLEPSAVSLEEQRSSVPMAVDSIVAKCRETVVSSLSALPGLDEYRATAELSGLVVAGLSDLDALEQARNEIKATEHNRRQASTLVEIAVECRKLAVQQAVDEVAGEANRLYSVIHPNEPIGNARLGVAQRGQASLGLAAEFYSRSEDPRLHYSESHLDTLGLCFFLAIRKFLATKHKDFRLLVLDDVLHSVDARHRLSVAKLILGEFQDHQMLITTHDQIWFQRFIELASAYGIAFRPLRITGWSIDSGPKLGDMLSDAEMLRNPPITMRSADLVAVAGRMLEELLGRLCEGLEIPVVFRMNRRVTVGDLWPVFLKRAEKQQGFAAVSGEVLKVIDGFAWVRNEIGAHYNESDVPVSDSEARAFTDAVLALYDRVRCPNCGKTLVKSSAPKNLWSCFCGHLAYPSKAPKLVGPQMS